MATVKRDTTYAVTLGTLQQIILYIEDHLTEPLTPKGIAEAFFLSVSSVNLLFRAICDLSIMEYIRNRRLTQAGQELLTTRIPIIDLAFQYGYETPEAFSKAFTRFHGFPPSLARRLYPEMKHFAPLDIHLELKGGYNQDIQTKGGLEMKTIKTHSINTEKMRHREDWRLLLQLAKKLDSEGIAFKVDGKTMVFAHGLDFKLDKICLTFKWREEERVRRFFGMQEKNHANTGMDPNFQIAFKYFDALFEGMKIRCMFYGNSPEADSDDFLYRNTDLVEADGQRLYVQTVAFYLENAATKDPEFYERVKAWYKKH